jgi:carboxypeptidase Taq
VGDLPGAWNEGMRDLLGVVPPDDRLGCLQDIHWPGGAFGYFPCYTLGAVLAAQLFGAAQAEVPGLLEAIGRGDFGPLLGWLRERVHGQGAKPSFADLVVHATGAPLAAEPFLEHLRARYLGERT